MEKIKIAVIGLGHWGPNHARHFSRLSNLVAICDSDQNRLDDISKSYNNCKYFQDYKKMFSECDIDAVVIATPTSTHEKLVTDSLNYGKHVLCEKPLALNFEVSKKMCADAKNQNLVLMVGHTFLFNQGIQYIRNFIQKKQHGKLYYIHSKRTHYGLFRPDVNVVWDLACHDVAIFNYILDSEPFEVSAVGFDWLQPGIHDLSFISLRYPNEAVAHIHVSWLDPKKEREITVVGDKKIVVWNDTASPGPITIYDLHVAKKLKLLPCEGNIVIPKINLEEPMLSQDKEFLNAIIEKRTPLSDGLFASNIVRILESINDSILLRGSPAKIK